MTREEAIQRLKEYAQYSYGIWHNDEEDTKAFDVAIEALSAESEDRHYIRIYADDEPSVKAEKLYQICGETQNREVAKWLKEYFLSEDSEDGKEQKSKLDLISRQDAIDFLIENMNWYTPDGCEASEKEKVECVTELINGVPSTDRWIPCSERLPEKDGRYLFVRQLHVDRNDKPIYWVSIAWYGKPLMPTQRVKGKCWYIPDDGDVVIDDVVLAWMPLPEPYEGGRVDESHST